MKFAITAALAATILLMPVASFAASEDFCDEYASQAVISATQNKSRQCGYGGPRWGFDYDTHYDWCLQVPEGAAYAERQGRKNDIQACFQNGGGGGNPNKGKVFFCKDYANQAVIARPTQHGIAAGASDDRIPAAIA